MLTLREWVKRWTPVLTERQTDRVGDEMTTRANTVGVGKEMTTS